MCTITYDNQATLSFANFIYTKATKDDINELCKLLTALFSQEIEFSPNEMCQINGLTQILDNARIGEILVCKYQGKIIAMVSLLYSVSTALGAKVATLEDMIVDVEYRGQGVGDRLLEYTIQYAKNTDAKETIKNSVST